MLDTINLDVEKGQRVLIISDIHGNLELFKKALIKTNFHEDDILIINGDISEKGDDSIGLFLYLIDLKKTHKIYCTLGNCDHLINHFNQPEYNDGMTQYMNSRKKTILNEVKIEMGGNPSYLERIAYFKRTYPEIIDFVSHMPLVIDTPFFTCTHAALREDGKIDRQYNTQERDFYNHDVSFLKPVIVGHYPVCLYDDEMISHNVKMDFEKNIISIDGANQMKELGQINILIFQEGQFTSTHVDNLQYEVAAHGQEQVLGTHINWANNGISIIEKGVHESLVHHPYSGKNIYVNNFFLNLEDEVLLYDTTDSFIQVTEGDLIHVQLETEDKLYIKCNGNVGWYSKKDL